MAETLNGGKMTTWTKKHTLEMVCPYCDKDFNVLLHEKIITHEDWQALVKKEVQEMKERDKKAREAEKNGKHKVC
jgi:hypothetical protein